MKISFKLPRWAWFSLLGIALLLAFVWVATTSGPLAPIKVTVIRVARGEVAPALFGVGTIEARRAYLTGPTVPGRARIPVAKADAVRAGGVICSTA